jgi:HlyD family secretion protein
MLKNNAATQKQLDDINTQIAVLNNQIRNINLQSRAVLVEKNSVKAQMDQIAYLIEHSLIKSLINGTILETFIKTGELAIPGKPICAIQNIKHLILRAYVTEPQLAQIKLNQKVIIQVDYGKTLKEQEGTIIWISDKAEFTPKQIQTVDERKNLVYAIKIKVANPDGIYKIGMPASVILKK